MAWQDTHKQESRTRILESAAFLFARLGYNQVGIGELMQHAGLTRGAFYAHFSSKAELYAEALIFAGQQLAVHFQQPQHDFGNFVKGYLHERNLTEHGISCPLACLITDVTHSEEGVKHSYTGIFKGLITQLQKYDSDKAADDILLDAVTMIGAMAVGRTLTDPVLARRLLRSCQRRLLGEGVAAEEQ